MITVILKFTCLWCNEKVHQEVHLAQVGSVPIEKRTFTIDLDKHRTCQRCIAVLKRGSV